MSNRGLRGSTTERRTFLKSAGSLVTISAFAGCTGDGSSDGGDGDQGSDGAGGDGASTTAGPAVDYPSDTVEFVVPAAAGGGFDAYARLMSPYLEDALGGPVVVKNIQGAGHVVGLTNVYETAPDGHSLVITDVFDAPVPQIGTDVGYDISEMTHVGAVTQSPNALVIMQSAGIDSWDTFVDNVSDLTFATQGNGAVSHIGMMVLGGITGEFPLDDLTFVHYNGTGPALGGLEKGEADALMVGTSTSAVKVVQALDAEMFAVFADEDHQIADYMDANDVDVKHYASDLALDNLDEFSRLTTFRRFVTGPPDVPESIQQKQVEAFEAVINDDEFLTEAREAARPLINPEANPDRVAEELDRAFETLGSEPYKSTIQDAMGG